MSMRQRFLTAIGCIGTLNLVLLVAVRGFNHLPKPFNSYDIINSNRAGAQSQFIDYTHKNVINLKIYRLAHRTI